MFSPNNLMLTAAEAGPDGLQLRVWELESGNEVLARRNLFPLRWSPDSRYLLTYGASCEGSVNRSFGSATLPPPWENLRFPFPAFVQAWEVLPSAPAYQLERPVRTIDFDPGGSRLAVDNTLWEVARTADGARLRRSAVEVTGLRSLALTADGVWGAVSHLPPSVRFADLVALRQLKPVQCELRPYYPDAEAVFPQKDRIAVPHLKEIAVSPDDRRALLAWEMGWWAGEDVRRAARLQLGRVLAAAPNPLSLAPVLALKPERLFETGVNHSDIHGSLYCLETWDLKEWKRLAVLYKGDARSFRLTPDGRHLLVATGSSVQVRNAENGDLERTLTAEALTPGLTTIPRLGLSPEGGRVLVRAQVSAATGGSSNPAPTPAVLILLFDFETGRALRTWTAGTGTWTAEALSSDGQYAGSGDEDGTLHLWDAATGQERARWRAHEAGVTALAFSPDGHLLVSGSSDGTLKLWHLPSIRKELATLGLDW
jgi:WD40 repeat protein